MMRPKGKATYHPQLTLLGIEATIFATALIAGQLGTFEIALALIPLLLLAAVMALAAGLIKDEARDTRTAGAGFLGLGAALGLPLWMFGVTLMVYPDDVERACVEALGRAGIDQNLEIVRSFVPPGLFCVPEEGGTAPILASLTSDLLVSLGVLLLLIAALACAIVLSARAGVRARARAARAQ